MRVAIHEWQIISTVKRLSIEIENHYLKNQISRIEIICLLDSGIHFYSDLLRCIERLECGYNFLNAKLKNQGHENINKIVLNSNCSNKSNLFLGKHCLIVDCFIDERRTEKIITDLERSGAKSIQVCSLLTNDNLEQKFKMKFLGISLEGNLVRGDFGGYGLSISGNFRNHREILRLR